jgi:HD-like signal output (HDOD) protein
MEIHKKIESVSKIPTLPEIAVNIMKKTSEDSNSSISEIANLIQKDASLTSNVLKLVNSPFYNTGKSIGNLHQALVILGTIEIRNLVISISLYSIYQSKKISPGFKRIWKNSFNTALVSQYISQTISHRSEQLFISSLLHNIGLILIHQNVINLATEFDENRSNQYLKDKVFEEQLFGTTHEQLGTYAATLWGFPESILFLIENHHQKVLHPEYQRELEVLQLANFYSEYHHEMQENQFVNLDMDFFPMVENLAEEFPEHDFLNPESEFFQQIMTLLDGSGEFNLNYH